MCYSPLLESLLDTTCQGAAFLLHRLGRIVPGGVYFLDEADPRVDFCFPLEDHRQATDAELLALVERELRTWAVRPRTCALAVVAPGDREGQPVMVLQAETRTERVVLHCPVRRKLWWRVLGEPQEAQGLLVEPFWPGDGEVS